MELKSTGGCPFCGSFKIHFCVKTFKNTSLYEDSLFIKNTLYKIKALKQKNLLELFKHDLCEISKIFYDFKVVPIPLSEARMHVRGFNQSFEIAKMLGLEVINCLTRIDSQTQSLKSFQERLRNPPIFKLHQKIHNEKILIVDDIYTTGITLLQVYQLFDPSNYIETFTLVRIN